VVCRELEGSGIAEDGRHVPAAQPADGEPAQVVQAGLVQLRGELDAHHALEGPLGGHEQDPAATGAHVDEGGAAHQRLGQRVEPDPDQPRARRDVDVTFSREPTGTVRSAGCAHCSVWTPASLSQASPSDGTTRRRQLRASRRAVRRNVTSDATEL
jgi:hypothetical protein